MYATYEDYRTIYGGTALSATEFPRLALLAGAYLDQITFGRAARASGEPVRQALALACCAVAELQKQADSGGELTGETTTGYSYTRSGTGQPLSVRMRQTAERFLAGTGLLYRGGEGCGCGDF